MHRKYDIANMKIFPLLVHLESFAWGYKIERFFQLPLNIIIFCWRTTTMMMIFYYHAICCCYCYCVLMKNWKSLDYISINASFSLCYLYSSRVLLIIIIFIDFFAFFYSIVMMLSHVRIFTWQNMNLYIGMWFFTRRNFLLRLFYPTQFVFSFCSYVQTSMKIYVCVFMLNFISYKDIDVVTWWTIFLFWKVFLFSSNICVFFSYYKSNNFWFSLNLF